MYSTKNIDKILLSAAMSEKTQNRYQFFNDYSADEFIEQFFSKDFSEAYQAFGQGHRIYRGDKRLEGNTVIGVTPGIRVSQNTSNTYTSLFSGVLPSWDEYPPRNKCAVCTNNVDKALVYANREIFYIFPKNGTKIGICPKDDIWYCFKILYSSYSVASLAEFNNDIVTFASIVLDTSMANAISMFNTNNAESVENIFHDIEYNVQNIIDNKIEENTKLNNNYYNIEELAFEDFFHDIQVTDDYFRQHIYDWQSKKFVKNLTYRAYQGNIIDWLDEILSPKANGFKLGTIFDIPNGNNEIWFSAPYLMISNKYFNELFN